MYYFFVCRAHSKLKDNPKVFSSPLSPSTARRDVAASVAAVIMNGICISLRTPAPKTLSLFLFSATRVAFCTRHFKIAHTHTDPCTAPAESAREKAGVLLSRRRRRAVLKTYFLLSYFPPFKTLRAADFALASFRMKSK